MIPTQYLHVLLTAVCVAENEQIQSLLSLVWFNLHMLSNNQQGRLLPVSLNCSLLIAPSVCSHNVVPKRTVIYVKLDAAN